MRLSEDKARQISHECFDALIESRTVDLAGDEVQVRREIKIAVTEWLKNEEAIEESVRKTIRSYSRKVPEGTPEYDLLFQKHYKEELVKRGKL